MRQPAEQVDLRREFNEVGIGEVLDQLDRELIGLKPVKTRIREIASLLLIERIRKRMGLTSDVPTLHMSFTGNPGTGKTTVALRIAEHPAQARLRAPRAGGVGDARRTGRAIYRPHRAEDQGDPEEGDGRRAVHRRGLLSAPARQRARLRPGGDRDPAAGDGIAARGSGGDPRRLWRPHGQVLRQQSRLPLAHRAPHRFSGLCRRRTARDRRTDAAAT